MPYRFLATLTLLSLLSVGVLTNSQAGSPTLKSVCVGRDVITESTVFYSRFLGSSGLRYENTSYYHAVDAVLADQATKLCESPTQKLQAILEVQFDTCRSACHRLAPSFSVLRADEMAEECDSVCRDTLEDRRIAASHVPEGPSSEAARSIASEHPTVTDHP